MTIDDVILGQRVEFRRDKEQSTSPIVVGMRGVVAETRPAYLQGALNYELVGVLWEGFHDGWKYRPQKGSRYSLQTQPSYAGAPRFDDYCGWCVYAEEIEPVQDHPHAGPARKADEKPYMENYGPKAGDEGVVVLVVDQGLASVMWSGVTDGWVFDPSKYPGSLQAQPEYAGAPRIGDSNTWIVETSRLEFV